jgi:hypothetical protein
MHSKAGLLAFTWVLLLSSAGSPRLLRGQNQQPAAADPHQLSAQATLLRNPGSLCDVPTPRGAYRMAFREATTTVRGCADLDTARLIPVLLAVRNMDTSQTVAFRIPLLSEVTVRTARGERTARAVWISAGQNSGFAVELTGTIEAQLRPRDTLWLMYLIPTPLRGSRLQVQGLVPVAVPLE